MHAKTFRDELADCLKADLPYHAFVLLYGTIAFALAILIGSPEKLTALLYVERFFPLVLMLLSLQFAWIALTTRRADSPLSELKTRLRRRITAQRVSRFLLFVNVAVFYGIFTSVKRMLSEIQPFRHDRWLADLDRAVHGADPWTLVPHSEALIRALQYFYLTGWLSCLVLITFYVIMFQARWIVTQYLWTFYLTWIILGNFLAGIFMSAGPAYYYLVTGDDRFAPLLDGLEFSYGMASSSVTIQDYLWLSYLLDMGGVGTGISAFPSLHVGMATLWILVAWVIDRRLFVLMIATLGVVQLASVYLGWHYAIDGYFSCVFVVLLWAIVGAMVRRRGANPAVQTRPSLPPSAGN